MRAFDAKDESTAAVMQGAPTMLDRLDGDDAEHFAAVRELLDQAGVDYVVDPGLVRGLDYYTRTVFEFISDRLGAQSALAGGGRYDGLVELLGGPTTPACGWAAGIDRIAMAMDEEEVAREPGVFVAAAEGQGRRALALVIELRRRGLRAELDLGGRGMKGQMKQADRIGAARTVILDEDGKAQVRDMQTGEQRELDLSRAAEELS